MSVGIFVFPDCSSVDGLFGYFLWEVEDEVLEAKGVFGSEGSDMVSEVESCRR